MKVILKTDIDGVGKIRQTVEVKTGYANNYLFKNDLAVPATPENMKKLNDELVEIARNEAQLRAQAELLRDKLNGKMVKLYTKAGSEGKLYGAATSADIASAVEAEYGIAIDKRKFETGNIKTLGIHEVKIKLYPKIEALIKVDVKAQQ